MDPFADAGEVAACAGCGDCGVCCASEEGGGGVEGCEVDVYSF